ncbi:MAG: hypothetical protein L6R40_002336 [Gallowayella cf. fulva]|nr:MAG: hypothetical protein L6R40_002336 [Xanthomendoza cf. fulva]
MDLSSILNPVPDTPDEPDPSNNDNTNGSSTLRDRDIPLCFPPQDPPLGPHIYSIAWVDNRVTNLGRRGRPGEEIVLYLSAAQLDPDRTSRALLRVFYRFVRSGSNLMLWATGRYHDTSNQICLTEVYNSSPGLRRFLGIGDNYRFMGIGGNNGRLLDQIRFKFLEQRDDSGMRMLQLLGFRVAGGLGIVMIAKCNGELLSNRERLELQIGDAVWTAALQIE